MRHLCACNLLSDEPANNRRRSASGDSFTENDYADNVGQSEGAQGRRVVPVWQWRLHQQPPPFVASNAAAVQLVLDVAAGTAVRRATLPPKRVRGAHGRAPAG